MSLVCGRQLRSASDLHSGKSSPADLAAIASAAGGIEALFLWFMKASGSATSWKHRLKRKDTVNDLTAGRRAPSSAKPLVEH
jgi:hypothetical protein